MTHTLHWRACVGVGHCVGCVCAVKKGGHDPRSNPHGYWGCVGCGLLWVIFPAQPSSWGNYSSTIVLYIYLLKHYKTITHNDPQTAQTRITHGFERGSLSRQNATHKQPTTTHKLRCYKLLQISLHDTLCDAKKFFTISTSATNP